MESDTEMQTAQRASDSTLAGVDQVIAYHERTKHHFHRFAASLGYLDWATQPDPFRRFVGAPLQPLPLGVPDPPPGFDDLMVRTPPPPCPLTGESMSKFLELSLALSAWKQFGQSKWALRINPSSGNLHPTEGYIITGSISGFSDRPGAFHYAPREHALECRTSFTPQTWASLASHWPEGSFFVALTSIHWREAWKYGERAFRYCQHDIGHALAALTFAARLLGWTLGLLQTTSDATIEALLGLHRASDFDEAEQEAPDLLAVVAPFSVATPPQGQTLPNSAVREIAEGQWFGQANRLSRDHVAWEAIEAVHAATRKREVIFEPVIEQRTPFPDPILRRSDNREVPAAQIIRQRRSAVDFDGRTDVEADQFFLMLDRVLPRWDRPPWNALGPPACIDLVLFVHRVRNFEPGLYCLVRSASRLEALRSALHSDFAWEKPGQCPDHLLLFRLETGDARHVAKQVSCHQDIAADGVFSCGMIADFEPNLRDYGAWFYRRLFWETGVIGQVLYLEAEAAGIRGTGIGCFFDDPVHEVFGLRDRRFQSLYHFTVGGPVDDLRLMTWPPYERRQ